MNEIIEKEIINIENKKGMVEEKINKEFKSIVNNIKNEIKTTQTNILYHANN